ncbi:gp53-like domain-containing protein, partial [Candidatus Pantoea gossypiicola]
DFPAISRGWGVTTDGKDGSGNKVTDPTNGIPPMEWFNALQKRTDEAIQWLLQNALPDWAAGTWPAGAVVVNGGVVWRAQKETATEPAADAGDWLALFPVANLDKRYLNADKNLSDLTDTAKARKALSLDKVGNWNAVQANGGLHSSGNHHIYIDWGGDSKFHGTVDSTDVGEFFTTQNPPTAAQAGAVPMSGGALNEEASLSVISSVKDGASGQSLYGPLFRSCMKGRGGDGDFKDGGSVAFRIVEVVSNYAFAEILFDGYSSIQSFQFRNDGTIRSPGSVYAGGAYIATDGNIYGSVWGGFLNNWIAGQISAGINNNNSGWVLPNFQLKNTGSPGGGWWKDSATGLIIQAGTVAVPVSGSTGSASFSFPLTFPNGVVSITGNAADQASSAGYVACAAFQNLSTAGAHVLVDTNASRNMDRTQYVRYIAYGV